MPAENDGVLLNLGWYRSDVVDASDGEQLTHLLETDLGVAACDHSADPLAFDPLRLVLDLIVDAELFEHNRGEIGSAGARGIGDRLGLEQCAF